MLEDQIGKSGRGDSSLLIIGKIADLVNEIKRHKAA